jgi:pilus assembly protein Flp/PilA
MAGGADAYNRYSRRRADGPETPPKELLMLTTFEFVAAWMRSKADTERGASLVEYALLLALIAVVCIVAITALGNKASGNFSSVDSNLN